MNWSISIPKYDSYFMTDLKIDLNPAWKYWQDCRPILGTHTVDDHVLFHPNQLRHTCSPSWFLSITSDWKKSVDCYWAKLLNLECLDRCINSHGMRWQWTAKILWNADNGGNEHDSSKMARDNPPEIQRRIFCDKYIPKKLSAEISPEINRKMTGNHIFQTTNRISWALEIHNSCQF